MGCKHGYRMADEYLYVIGYANETYVPERMLCGAILERAIRDLFDNATPMDRRDAIAWFRAEYKDTGLTFELISEVLNLGADILKIIEQEVNFSDLHYGKHKLETKGLTCGEGDCELAKGKRLPFGSQNPAILRLQRGRFVGYSLSRRAAELAHRIQRDQICRPKKVDDV